MSTSAISSLTLTQPEYFQTRRADLNQLGEALASGDLSGAQSAFNSIVALGKQGPFVNGDPFAIAQREKDFVAIGKALQSGDLAGAQQAFDALKGTFTHSSPIQTIHTDTGGGTTTTGSGPEIILNLGSGGNVPQQITLDITNASNGGEKVALSFGSQGGSTEQVTFNLPANSNEQLVVNLLDQSASTTSSSSATPSGGNLSVSA